MIQLKSTFTRCCQNTMTYSVLQNYAKFNGSIVRARLDDIWRRAVHHKNVTSKKSLSSLDHAEDHPISVQSTENDGAFKKLEAQYPQAHGTLKNIMAIVAKEVKGSEKSLDIVFKPVGSKHITAWTCQCHLSWPSSMSFSAVAKTKQEAARMASLKVIQWLTLAGKVKGNKAVLIDGKVLSNLKKTNVQLQLNELSVSTINEILNSYDEKIKELIQNSLDECGSIVVPTEERISELRIPESQRARMANARNNLLQRRVMYRMDDESLTDIIEKQEELPIFKFKETILQTVKKNQVVVIKGEPGCGKSTQVPQYILDDAARAGNACDVNIIVTQPRRISAITLAERVSKERGEQIGDSVGFQVRFKARHPKPPGGSIRFCSSGILLRTMQSNPNLEGVSHVILDEAHERDVNTDMLMLLLKRVLAQNPNLKLVVMSATINPELFQNYYPGAEALSIPGFTYPVQSYFLDEITQVNLAMTKNAKDGRIPRLFHNEIANVIQWIDRSKPPGAILCFLPGWQDIKAVMGYLQKGMDPATSVILPLHSRLTFDDQSRVFQNPPPGVRKVILSTNVAETSVTIDDVAYVLDTGVHKEERLSADKGSAVLDDDWVSQANVNQRRGRAGRVRPGESYHLYTRGRFGEMPRFPIPELHRVPLQKVVLDLKTYNEEERAVDFLSGMPEPPSVEATQCAVDELVLLGALTPQETLTSLGRRIAKFSTSPRISKALVYAAILKCLDPVLTISSILSADADMFSNSLEERAEIMEIKREYDKFSDHFAVLRIYNQWNKLYKAREPDEMFCIRNMLRGNTLRLVDRIRKLSLEQLTEAKMVMPEEEERLEDVDLPVSPEFVKAVFLSGTLSYLFQRSWDIKNGKIKMNTTSMITEGGSRASLASDSVCHKQSQLPSPFLTYFRKQESSVRRATIVRDASIISPLALALFIPKLQGRSSKLSATLELAVIDDRRNQPFRLLATSRDAAVLRKLSEAIAGTVEYFLSVEGITPKDEYYQQISEFRDLLVLALSDLLEKSTHTTHFNDQLLPAG